MIYALYLSICFANIPHSKYEVVLRFILKSDQIECIEMFIVHASMLKLKFLFTFLSLIKVPGYSGAMFLYVKVYGLFESYI